MAILKDIKYLIFHILLILVITYLLGLVVYQEAGTISMVMIMGWMIAGPVCLINAVFLFFSDVVKNKYSKFSLIFLPIILFFLYTMRVSLNMAITPSVLIFSISITNITWSLNSRKK